MKVKKEEIHVSVIVKFHLPLTYLEELNYSDSYQNSMAC